MSEDKQVDRTPHSESDLGLTVIFKGSNRCNARCVFCSVGEAGAKTIAWDDFEILAREIQNIVDRWEVTRLGFTFHGGEPTMLGADFIDRACQRIREIPVKHDFTMQSNLLWRDEALLETITRNRIQVGTSIDPIVGDRRTPEGNDAFPEWLEGFFPLAALGPAPGAIFVVTRSALGQAGRLYRIAEAIGDAVGERFGLQLNPVYAQGRAAGKQKLLVSAGEFGEFLVEMYRLWEESGRSVSLTPIQQIADNLTRQFDGQHLICTFSPDCSPTHIGVDYDLNVAGCGRRLDSGAFFGNLRDSSLIELVEESRESKIIAQRSQLLNEGECHDCRYFKICHGGCPDDAWLSTGEVAGRFGWCESYRMLFEVMEAELGEKRRRPVSQPRARQKSEQLEVVPGVDAAEMQKGDGGNRTEYCLLPTEDGAAFRFDSGLVFPHGKGCVRMRLWVHNRHAKSLVMWEELLKHPGVCVVLFECDGLEESLNLLNALNATVSLDVVRILRNEAGESVLHRLFERYVSDPLWKSQVFPFANILENAMHDRSVQFVTSWGMPPETFHVRPLDCSLSGMAGQILEEYRADADLSLAGWMVQHRPCLECDVRKICGGCLAPGTGDPCHPAALQMVHRLQQVAAEVRAQWENAAAE